MKDILGVSNDTKLFSIFLPHFTIFLNKYLEKTFQNTKKVSSKELYSDFRVKFIQGFQIFTNDYLESLKVFKNYMGIPDFSKKPLLLSSEFSAISLIVIMSKSISTKNHPFQPILNLAQIERLDNPILLCKTVREELDIKQAEFCLKIAEKIIPIESNEIDIFKNFQFEIIQAFVDEVINLLSEPALWSTILHKLPHIDLPKFPETNESKSRYSKNSDKHIESKIGYDLVNLIRNLLGISQPSGLAGILASICNHILDSYAEDLGKAICEELKHPLDLRRVEFVCLLFKRIFWHDCQAEHVFITRFALFSQLKNERSRRSNHEMLVSELTEFIFHQIESSSGDSAMFVGWMKNSLDSIRQTLANLIHLFLELTQSSLIIRFIILQYILQ